MNDYNNNFTPQDSFTPIKPDLLDLRKRSNVVGIITIVGIVAFYLISYLLSTILREILMQYPVDYSIDALPNSFFGGLVNLLALGVGGVIFIKLKKEDISKQLPFSKVNTSTLISLIIIGFSFCMLSNFLTSIFIGTTSNLGFDFSYASSSPVSNSVSEIIASVLAVAFVPAVAEEIMFRGAIMSTLRKYGDGTAILVSAIIFGLFHTNMVQIPFAFIVGVILGWAVVYSGSMLPAILIHFTNNLFSVTSGTLQSNAERWNISEGILSLGVSIFVVIMALSAIICAIKLSRQDKTFLYLNNYHGELEKKEITKTIITNPAIIGAVVILIIETINNHLP